jgi:hypothetical protein
MHAVRTACIRGTSLYQAHQKLIKFSEDAVPLQAANRLQAHRPGKAARCTEMEFWEQISNSAGWVMTEFGLRSSSC